MQEEVTRKTIALAIKAAKLDGKMLQAALRKLLQLYRKARDTPHHGKQTLKQLMRHGTGVSNIERNQKRVHELDIGTVTMASAISKIPKRKMSCLPLLKMWNSFFIVSGIMIL